VSPLDDTKLVKAKNGNTNLVCLLNSFVYLSGGDVRFTEIFKRSKQNITVITPMIGEHFCRTKRLAASYYLTTHEASPRHVALTYIIRIFKAVPFFKDNVHNADIFYGTSDCLPDVIPCFISKTRNRNLKWVQVIHHVVPLRKTDSKIYSPLHNLISFWSQRLSFFFIKKYCDLIITINPAVNKELQMMGFNANQISVNSNGIDLEFIEKIVPNKATVYDCIFLGRLHPSKGLFDLIAIWEIVCKKRPAKLGIIGFGDRKFVFKLKKEIDRRGLTGNIELLGYVEPEKAYGIIKSSKLFVFPSHEEGFGIAILEAMACKIPVITYDLPSYVDIYGENISKVPLGNYSQFADTIIHLLANDKLREKFGIEGLTLVKKYDWDKISQREMALFKGL
jgi:glycosyltransferase involved in cell wall biosynthesis